MASFSSNSCRAGRQAPSGAWARSWTRRTPCSTRGAPPLIPEQRFGCNAAFAYNGLVQLIQDLDLLTRQLNQMEAGYRVDANRIRHNILQPPPRGALGGLRVQTTAERIALGTVQLMLRRLLQIGQQVKTLIANT